MPEKKHPRLRGRFPNEFVDKLPLRKPNETNEAYSNRIRPIVEEFGFKPYDQTAYYIPDDLLSDALSEEEKQSDPDWKEHGYNVLFVHDFDQGPPDEDGHLSPMLSIDLKKYG